MSHSRAYAFTRGIPDADLRLTLLAAVEAIYHVSDTIESYGTSLSADTHAPDRALALAGDAIVEAAESIRQEVESAQQQAAEADARAEEAETQDPREVARMKEQIAALEKERDDAIARVDSVKTLVESHADLVAMARRFTSAAVTAGVPLKHARIVATKQPKARKAGVK